MAKTTTTLLQLRDQYRYRLGDVTKAYWSDAYLERAIRDGAREYGALGDLVWSVQTIDVIGGQDTYTLAADFRSIDRVYFEHSRIEPAGANELKGFGQTLGVVDTGLVSRYLLTYTNPLVPTASQSIRLVKAPGANAAGALIIFYWATITVDSNGLLSIPESYLPALWWFVARRAYAKEGEAQNLRLASIYKGLLDSIPATLARRASKAQSERVVVVGGGSASFGRGRPARPYLGDNFGPIVRRERGY